MRPVEEPATRQLLDALATFPVNVAAADRAAGLVQSARRRGRMLALPDALIAATAVDAELLLVTCNGRDFSDLGLPVKLLSPHS